MLISSKIEGEKICQEIVDDREFVCCVALKDIEVKKSNFVAVFCSDKRTKSLSSFLINNSRYTADSCCSRDLKIKTTAFALPISFRVDSFQQPCSETKKKLAKTLPLGYVLGFVLNITKTKLFAE